MALSRKQIKAIKAKEKKFTFATNFSVVAKNEDDAFQKIIDKVSESPTSVFFVKKSEKFHPTVKRHKPLTVQEKLIAKDTFQKNVHF